MEATALFATHVEAQAECISFAVPVRVDAAQQYSYSIPRGDRLNFHSRLAPVYAEMTKRSRVVVFHCRAGQIRSAVMYIDK